MHKGSFKFLVIGNALLTLALLPAWIQTLTPVSGWLDANNMFVGRDFMFFYNAAHQALIGLAHDLYSHEGLHRAMQYTVPADQLGQIPAWPYPPHFLPLFMPFALLPYGVALGLWLFLSIAAAAFTLRYWNIRPLFLALGIVNIPIIVCLLMGQNTLLLASFTGLGIALLRKRPALAGICFALVSIKPHIALLIPLALICGRYWQALFYTAGATLLLILLSCITLGWDIWWQAFSYSQEISHMVFSPDMWISTIYATYRGLTGLGASPMVAMAAHIAVALTALYFLHITWRARPRADIQWLSLALAGLLVNPYSFSYDAVLLILPLSVWLAHKPALDKKHLSLCALHYIGYALVSSLELLQPLIVIYTLFLLGYIAREYEQKNQ